MHGILLTRSMEENESAANTLSALGYAPYHAPMVFFRDLPYDFDQTPAHIIVTSNHGAKIAAKNITKPTECWVVGQSSADILQKNKYIKITGRAQNLKNLMDIISMIPAYEAEGFFGNSLYLSGNIVTNDLPAYIKRAIIYETSYAKGLPKDVIAASTNGRIKYITICSKNCAVNLIALFKRYKLMPYLQNSVVIAISPEVAGLFYGICSKSLHSEEATFPSMIKLLKTV